MPILGLVQLRGLHPVKCSFLVTCYYCSERAYGEKGVQVGYNSPRDTFESRSLKQDLALWPL